MQSLGAHRDRVKCAHLAPSSIYGTLAKIHETCRESRELDKTIQNTVFFLNFNFIFLIFMIPIFIGRRDRWPMNQREPHDETLFC